MHFYIINIHWNILTLLITTSIRIIMSQWILRYCIPRLKKFNNFMQSCGYFFELSNSTFSTTAAAGPQLNAPSPSKTTVDPSSSSTKFALSGCIVFTVTMFYLPLFLSQDCSNSNQLCPKFPFIPSILFPILSSVQDLVTLVFEKK